jgi:c-di-GMP-related signal transduction protein
VCPQPQEDRWGSGGSSVPPEVLVGRQPIVDRAQDVVGFELLYRTAEVRPEVSGEQMTASVVLGALTIGLEQLVGDRLIFCNADRGVLLGETAVTLPPSRTVIEVLETVDLDEEVLEGCRLLVQQGFRLALDDFVWKAGAEPFLALASIVKVDFLATPRDRIAELAQACRSYGVRLLAEKVETDDDVAWARAQGFDLFQGYAIERPSSVPGRTVPTSSASAVQLAVSLLTDEVEFDELKAILRREPGMVVQLLQIASLGRGNGLRRQVRTLDEALVLLGTVWLRQWVALTLLGGQPGAVPDGLAVALTRARTCELLAVRRGLPEPDFAFTAGLLSSLDLLLGLPVELLDRSLDLAGELKAAAFHGAGRVGSLVCEVRGYQDLVRGRSDRPAVAPDLDAAAAEAFVWAVPQS